MGRSGAHFSGIEWLGLQQWTPVIEGFERRLQLPGAPDPQRCETLPEVELREPRRDGSRSCDVASSLVHPALGNSSD